MQREKVKTVLHFNRVNMQRGNPNVWTAHNCRGCFQAQKIEVVHDGKVVLSTEYKPNGAQPRAKFVATAKVQTLPNGLVRVLI